MDNREVINDVLVNLFNEILRLEEEAIQRQKSPQKALQRLSSLFSLEDGKYGRAIINNSKTKIILNLEPDEAEYVRETLKLTRTEIRAITRFERGEALISSNNNKVPVVVKASKLEKEMITTDRAELEAILKERQREKTHSA